MIQAPGRLRSHDILKSLCKLRWRAAATTEKHFGEWQEMVFSVAYNNYISIFPVETFKSGDISQKYGDGGHARGKNF